jgi:RES domain-containing protein
MEGEHVFSGRSFRVVPPRWAHAPLSGEGARRHGGRFNPPGMAAFYSALDPHTAYAEYTQGLFDRPGLLCSFDVANARVIDLTTLEGPILAGLEKADLSARWMGHSDAPTQLAAVRIFGSGLDGLVYRSLQHTSGRNLVLWHIEPPVSVTLVDRMGEAVTRPLE